MFHAPIQPRVSGGDARLDGDSSAGSSASASMSVSSVSSYITVTGERAWSGLNISACKE